VNLYIASTPKTPLMRSNGLWWENKNGGTVGKCKFISYFTARDATSSRARERDAHSSRGGRCAV